MIQKTKKASVFIYILLLVHFTLIIWYIVLNNVFILNNNINIWKNAEEVFSSVFDKWNINIETIQRYNSNWDWYIDGISCPTNITMSWSIVKQTWIVSQMVYELWSIYCSAYYWGEEFRIFFNKDYSDFVKTYYKWDIVNLIQSTNTDVDLSTTNIASSSIITWSTPYNWHLAVHSADSNESTYFDSEYKTKNEFLNYQFPSVITPWWITIKKFNKLNWGQSWNNWYVYFYDSIGTELDRVTISWIKKKTLYDIDLRYSWLINNVKTIKLVGKNKKYLDVKEFEVYELESNWSEELWIGDRVFNDSDSTLVSFNSDWIGWWDDIDDNFNSDNYRVTSIDDVYYPNWFQDDDVVPRLTVFWSIKTSDIYFNIFWNNYKTNDFIDKNTNNDDLLNVKIWDIEQSYVYLDLFNEDNDIDYDMKILEFDPIYYKDKYTLLPLNSYEWKYLTNNVWYIQNNTGSLSISENKTWNEFEFDFKNKDYAIFMVNGAEWNLSYRMTAETLTWTMMYINPINDSNTWTIESLSNHIIIWWEKNFIWEDFVIVWSK